MGTQAQEDYKKLLILLHSLIEQKFYGELVIKMESGKIQLVRKTESIKLN